MRMLLLIGLLATTLVACGDSAGPSGEANIAGTYTLRTVNGQNVPFAVVVLGTYRLEVVSGSVTISGTGNSGTYTDQIVTRETQGTTTTTETENGAGTWTRTNNAIVFRDNADASTINGSLSANTITFVQEGITFVLRK
jgi:hypothetical protein